MDLNIRPAREEDRKAIKKIVRAAGLYPFELDWQHFYIAAVGNSIVGVGQIKIHRDGSRELASLAVVPEFQGRGVATALIHKLISISEGDLLLLCRDELEGFYQAFGFAVASRHELPRSIAIRQQLGSFFSTIVSFISRRPMKILAMRRIRG